MERANGKGSSAQLACERTITSATAQRREAREREREINNTTSNLIGRVCLISAMGDLDVRHDGREREEERGEGPIIAVRKEQKVAGLGSATGGAPGAGAAVSRIGRHAGARSCSRRRGPPIN